MTAAPPPAHCYAAELAAAQRHTPVGAAWDTVAFLAALVAAYAATIDAAMSGTVSYAAAALCLGFLAHLLYVVLHECTHRSLFGPARAAANDAVGTAIAALLMFDYSAHREIHMAHHAHTNDEVLDPDMLYGGTLATRPLVWLMGTFLYKNLGALPYVGPHLTRRAIRARRGPLADADQMSAAKERSLRWHGACVVGCLLLHIAGLGAEAAAFWFAPAAVADLLRVVVFAWLPHHPHAGQGRYDSARVILWGPPRVNAALSALLWGGHNYHAIHHMFPQVPTLRLRHVFDEARESMEAAGLVVEGAAGGDARRAVNLGSPADTPRSGPWSDGYPERRRGAAPMRAAQSKTARVPTSAPGGAGDEPPPRQQGGAPRAAARAASLRPLAVPVVASALLLAAVPRCDGAAAAPPPGDPAAWAGDRDNWGAPHDPVAFYKGKLKDVTDKCVWQTGRADDVLDQASLQFYDSIPNWIDFKGLDYIPEHRHTFEWSQHKVLRDAPRVARAMECDAPQPDGTTWSVQRIGPFKSTGNYDWWQFTWNDVFKFSKKLEDHPGGLYILNTFSGGVDMDGATIGFPPVHIHHVHITTAYKAVFRKKGGRKCNEWKHSEEEPFCGHPFNVAVEQHGDYQCTDEDGGVACLLEDLPTGYGKHIVEPLSINGEVNDVRAPDSPELVWWYQVAFRWVPGRPAPAPAPAPARPAPAPPAPAPATPASRVAESLRPLSFHYFFSPGRMDVNDQSTMVLTYKTPTDEDSFIWYTGYMWGAGSLLRGKMHTHNTVFDESFFIKGSPEDIGIGSQRFQPPGKSFDVMRVSDLGFENNRELKKHILDAYADTRRRQPAEGRDRPEIICHANTSNDLIGGYHYDRRAPTWCRPWGFEKGEQFTVIGFNKHTGTIPGPHTDRVPAWLPGHMHWFFMYSWPGAAQSNYTYGFYTQSPEATYPDCYQKSTDTVGCARSRNWVTQLVYFWNGGTPTHDQYRRAVAIFVGAAATAAIVAFAMMLASGRFVYRKLIKQD